MTKKEDKIDQTDAPSYTGATCTEENMETGFTELCNVWKEHMEASKDTKTTLSRDEATLDDVLERTAKLEQQIANVEQRVSDLEDSAL